MHSHTSTGLSPPGKYAPAGDAMTQYRYSADGRTPRPTSVAIAKGRRYIDSSPPAGGIQARSTASSSDSEARKSSSGSGAIPSRTADVRNRDAFASGRKDATDPSGCW